MTSLRVFSYSYESLDNALIAYCLLLIAYCLLLIAYRVLRIAYRVLRIAYCVLRIAYCVLRIAYRVINVGSSCGALYQISLAGFPQPVLRTGRAILTASGSPHDHAENSQGVRIFVPR